MESFKINIDLEFLNKIVLEGFDIESYPKKGNIVYQMEINYKSYGIEFITAMLPNQEIVSELELCDERGEIWNHEVRINLIDTAVSGKLSNFTNINNSLYPVTLELTVVDVKLISGAVFIMARGNLLFS